ncbi:GAF and HD-GYP domain-containing protein [Desulfotruncus alcoholivorax]|uniref:GAF and HD-GYP domain-containing protein n=1 Tax=Desulfotruncus alcoholivorax TaxID=265477 RepID=UPI0004149ABE|nr:HD domain-containing phosphohydrolase [Desulfotruncus alcoholivorax]
MQIAPEHLQTLLETSRLLNSQLELSNLLDLVLEKAIGVVEAEAGTLWMVEEDGYLVPIVARGPKADGLKGLKLKPGEGMAGQVVANNEPKLVEDVSKDPNWAKRFDDSTGFVTRSLLGIPLMARNKVIGCLQFVNKKDGGFFSKMDMELAMAFAGQAAISMDNSRMYTWQRTLMHSLLTVMASALDARDPYTAGHSERVCRYSVLTGKEMGMTTEELEHLERAALLHDIGKIGVRDNVLLKQGPLDIDEWMAMKSHAELGAKILANVEPHHLAGKLHEGALCHQEKYDGTGYPNGLKGEEIPLVARIIAVADTFDAITTDRPYRKGSPFAAALREINRCAGTHFDPEVAKVFITAMAREYNVNMDETGPAE